MSYEGGMKMKVISSCKLDMGSLINPYNLPHNNLSIVVYVYSPLIPVKGQLCALC